MIFLFIFLVIILMILTIRVKFEFIDFKFTSLPKEHLNNNYKIKIIVYIFEKIPILVLKITNEKIQKAMKNEKLKKVVKNQETKIIENRKNIDKELIKSLKNIKLQVEEMNLQISLGTEDASITAFIIPIISTIIAIFLSRKVKEHNDRQVFSITPIYINQNLINIQFSGILQIKMIHIINTICIVNKKRKGDKNERTSNRRSYDYGYE